MELKQLMQELMVMVISLISYNFKFLAQMTYAANFKTPNLDLDKRWAQSSYFVKTENPGAVSFTFE